MGESLMYSMLLPRSNIAMFAARLQGNLEPDSGFGEDWLRSAANEYGPGLDLTLRLPPDLALLAFRRENPDIDCSQPGQIAVGYLFANVRSHGDTVELTFYSTSSAVVEVMRESHQVRALFLALAGFCMPPEVCITDEWNDTTRLNAKISEDGHEE